MVDGTGDLDESVVISDELSLKSNGWPCSIRSVSSGAEPHRVHRDAAGIHGGVAKEKNQKKAIVKLK